jgi:hypothetical protein
MSMAHLKRRISEEFSGEKRPGTESPATTGRRTSDSATEEIVPGQHAECAGPYSGATSRRPLEARCLLDADPREGGGSLSVVAY